MKKCSKCQEFKDESCFYKDRKRKDGLYVYCKCCTNIINKEFYNKNKGKILNKRNKESKSTMAKNYRKTIDGRYIDYKHSSQQRGLEFDISIDDFRIFWQKPCLYCEGKIETIGLDRINPTIGYVTGNICSCCDICNRAKLTMSSNSWFNYLKQISQYQKGGEINKTESSKRNIIYKYKYKAKVRGLEFLISLEQFNKIIENGCHYCGRYGNIGIDRVNNLIGYVEDNCVPCCKNCNSGKRNNSYEVFMSWIKRIAQKYGKNVPSGQ